MIEDRHQLLPTSDACADQHPADVLPAEEPTFFPNTVMPASPRGRVMCDGLDISIDRDGVWFYHGSPISRKELVCLYASVLARDASGGYWLVTPAEMGRVQVEDAPFLAVEMFRSDAGCEPVISFRTNVDEIVTVDDAHPIRVQIDADSGEPRPYVTVRPGLEARIVRSVYYQLVNAGVAERVDGADLYGIWSRGRFFALGRLEGGPQLRT